MSPLCEEGFFIEKRQGSQNPQAIFDCVSGWGSYCETTNARVEMIPPFGQKV